MKIERYKDEEYKYFYEKVDKVTKYEEAEVPDELWNKYNAASEALLDAEIELAKYFKG